MSPLFTVLDERMERDPSGHTRRSWLCRCVCGDVRWRAAQHVKTGRSTKCKSCAAKKHGRSATRAYKAWYAMLHRCTIAANPWYARYGGRGITVCDKWRDFEAFLSDMGEPEVGLSLGRIDNDRGYEPSNCKWATRAEQMRNTSYNVRLTAFGKTQHAAEWCRERGLRQDTLHWRIKNGWPVEKALTTKTRKRV